MITINNTVLCIRRFRVKLMKLNSALLLKVGVGQVFIEQSE